jgi:hypothetical protein
MPRMADFASLALFLDHASRQVHPLADRLPFGEERDEALDVGLGLPALAGPGPRLGLQVGVFMPWIVPRGRERTRDAP